MKGCQSICVFLLFAAVFVQLSSAAVINVFTGRQNRNGVVSPRLDYCSGYFMETAYILKCRINTEDISFNWTKNSIKINQTMDKYSISTTGDSRYRFLVLTIQDINMGDVGRYELSVKNSAGSVQETFWITDIEACDNLMRCFENPCVWPMRMTCNSRPAARCVVDMCSTDPEHWCMPKWYEGLEQVTCENEEDFYNGGGF